MPKARDKDVVVQQLGDEVLVYDLKSNQAFCLNETSALIWQMCDGQTSVSDMSRRLTGEFKESAGEDLVWFAIDELKRSNLIANSAEFTNRFEGFNRRDVIKKVGLASMIALPLISAMIAPSAVNAASGQPLFCDPNPTTVNGVFQRGQGGFCRCTAATSMSGQACTPDPDNNNPGDPQICRSGCTCTSTQTGTPNGTCQ